MCDKEFKELVKIAVEKLKDESVLIPIVQGLSSKVCKFFVFLWWPGNPATFSM